MRDLEHYEIEKLNELIETVLSKQESFHHTLLLVTSTLLGVLVVLHPTSSGSLCTRLVFLAALLSVATATLGVIIVVIDLLLVREKSLEVYSTELHKSLIEERASEPVSVPREKRTLFWQKTSLISFVVSLILLAVYCSLSLF